ASGLTEGFDGVAPECQLLLMKVSSDSDEYISDAAVLAALCDAVALGADVVNMSFGESSALSDMYLSEINYSDIIAQALAQGTYVFAAAGNESRLGSGSAYDAPLSFAEDNGTVGLPANLADCVSVASADYSYPVYSSFLLAADATKILYYEDSAGGFTDSFANKTLRLVPVPGVGAEEDYEDIDVAGKIALIKRGEITFADKLTYAAEAGAKGAVIYDNAESSEPFTMQVNEGQIPSVSVTAADGELLLGEGSVYLQSGAPASYENKNAGMSSFSSWGPTPSLGLKPDIAAWGGNIYSCAPGDRYVSMSGTSMASPLCAAYALLAIESGNHDGRDLRAVMMNTASPVIDSVSGKEYSPRSQGAGLCDIDAALNAGLIITGDSGAAKIELGDGLSSSFKFTVTAENITETDITAAVSGSVLTDDYYYYGEKYVNAGSPLALSESSMRIDGGKNVNRYSEDSSVSEITVPAGDSVSFTVSVKLSSSEFAELAEAFDDGFYIDGYVYLETEGEQYSIPFMGYHGDWSALPVFSYDESFFGIVLSSLFVSGSDAYVYKLGTAVFSDDITSDSSLIAISPNGDGFGDYIGFDLALLRTVTSFEAEITDAGGEQVYTMAVDFPLVKAFDDGSGELNIYNVYDLWDGTDENDHDYTYPDGVYTITLRAYTEGQDEPQSVSYDFRIDTVKPSLDGWRIVEQDGKTILELDVSDDLGIMYAEVYSRYNADQTVKFDLVPSEAHTKTLRANITELENNGYFYLDLLDYAANQSTYRIDISGGN
ncbi:MAG: S8 family serine peptidase, partial [Eubacteriales bacterium]